MVFGGKLASILVCEKCKKVSLTYEDFNDLSLSIKPEDYARERKRDRIKQLAKKFRFRPHSAKELSVSVPMYRSSSVPPSPSRRSNDVENNGPESPENADPRRKSFEHVREDSGKSSEEEAKAPVRPSEETDGGFVKLKTSPEGEERDISEGTTRAAEVNGVEFDTRIGRPHEKVEVEQKKEKEDPWGKLGRRISVSMRMGKKEKRSSHSTERGIAHLTDGGSSPSAPPTPRKVKSSAGVDSGPDAAEASDTSRSRNISPSIVLSPSPLATPPIAINSSFPALRRSTTEPPRAKSPRPPKPSREEAAYLRRILADVHTSSPSTLALLQQALSGAATTVPPMTAQSLLSKLSHLPGIEECMRMFTSVEIMDGDNMVGCHRCWKIANGTYKPKHHEEGCEDEDGEEQLEDVERGQDRDVEENPVEINVVVQSGENSTPDSSPDLGKISPAMTTFSLVPSQPPSSIFIPDNASVSSAPTTLQSIPPTVKLVTPTLVPAPSLPLPVPPGSPTAHVTTFGGLPIPSISTTGPESPSSDPPSSLNEATADNDSIDASPRDSFSASLSNDSLLTPLPPRKSRSTEGKGLNTPGDSSESSDGEYGSSASDASGSVSPYSDTSPGVSPTASPHTSLEKLRSTLTSPKPLRPDFNRSHTVHPTPAPKVPKSQQVIMRRTYKRYLIATPPPVLVVHLKRFQQISRMYAMSFSTGFKKLDEFVAFPEYLDVTPFLAPKREDFGLDKKQKGKKSKEKNANGKVKEEKCMYRLYAVVVHIGNMVCFIFILVELYWHQKLTKMSYLFRSWEAITWRIPLFLKEVHHLLRLHLLPPLPPKPIPLRPRLVRQHPHP